MPNLAADSVNRKRVLKEYNNSIMLESRNLVLTKFFTMSLFAKVNNKQKRDFFFKELAGQSDSMIVFTLNDFCFNHYSICTLIRSSLFGNILNDEQATWFKKNISDNIWKLEHQFNVDYFLIDENRFDKPLVLDLFMAYEIPLPKDKDSMSLFNLKREFFRLKLRSSFKSLLDIVYLYMLGDKNEKYFKLLLNE